MKLNGALKPRQGASRKGSSPGVVLKKYRDKRYFKLNENVVYGLSFYECGPSHTEQKQYIVKYSKNNKNINRQTQVADTQSQQTSIQNQQENIGDKFFKSSDCDNSYNANSNSISSLSRETKKSLKIINKTTKYNRTIYTQEITVTKKFFRFIVFNSNREYSDMKEVRVAKEEEENLKNRNKINITTRQIANSKENKIYHNINRNRQGGKGNQNKHEKETQKTKELQIDKTRETFFKHHVNVNKTNNNNNSNNNKNNNNSDLIYSMEQQQEQLVVNKFLSIKNIYENLILCALIILATLISRFSIQLKLLLFFMYSHVIKHLDGGYPIDRPGRNGIGNQKSGTVYNSTILGCKSIVVTYGYKLARIMRASQSLKEPFEPTFTKIVNKSRLNPSIALWILVCAAVTSLLPQPVICDDGDNFFPINSIETTTPEFDYASRGQKKFGDKCENTLECGFPGSICDPKKKSCQCTEDLPVTNHIDKCGKEAAVNESCFFNEQCEVKYFQTECRDQRCVCRFDMTPVWLKDGTVECKGRGDKKGPETYIDPAMIGVLIGMALMFIIICVVLRLFSQARWRENRTIFNTPNPRLMNVSLLRESKLLHGQERRGSRMSVRVPSRQPSMASLRPHSPNPSLGKTGSRSNSHGSNASATSLRSTRSNSVSPAGIPVNNTHHERKGSTYHPHHHTPQAATQQEQQPLTQTNIISNPVAETVTVEIIEPEK